MSVFLETIYFTTNYSKHEKELKATAQVEKSYDKISHRFRYDLVSVFSTWEQSNILKNRLQFEYSHLSIIRILKSIVSST